MYIFIDVFIKEVLFKQKIYHCFIEKTEKQLYLLSYICDWLSIEHL